MTTLNDARFNALRAIGHTGATNDMLVTWLQDGGAISNCLPDAWLEMLAAHSLIGHRNDTWYALLGDLGFEGQINDRELAFWLGGGVLPPAESCHEMVAGIGVNATGYDEGEFGTFTPEEAGDFTVVLLITSATDNLILNVTPDTGIDQDQFDYLEVDGISVARTADANFGTGSGITEWLWFSAFHTADFVNGETYEVCFKKDALWNDIFIWDDNDIWDDNLGPQ